ncbi:50S ribosomal protein L10 [Candidatus Saccharibacteria bacterium]|nr:50S ribosomal protein L10 [Candidatus Saccharibacteria bacterium]
MALTKDKKNQVVDEVRQLLSDSKMTVVATYQGTPVKALQSFRRQARDNGTTLKVVKNRLVIKALEQNAVFKAVDTSVLNGMLLYAFNSQDEVAPAQVIANFAKTQPTLQFVGAFSAEGQFIGADNVKVFAALPSKPQLLAGIIQSLNSPLSSLISSLSGNLHGLLGALETKANQ